MVWVNSAFEWFQTKSAGHQTDAFCLWCVLLAVFGATRRTEDEVACACNFMLRQVSSFQR